MTNGTHDARTAGAPALRRSLTSRPGRQPVAAMPRGRLRALPARHLGAVWGAIQTISPLGHTRAVHPT
jgi:hypothetical protein